MDLDWWYVAQYITGTLLYLFFPSHIISINSRLAVVAGAIVAGAVVITDVVVI